MSLSPLPKTRSSPRCPVVSDCLIVDPGFEPDRVIEQIEQKKLTPAAILNTHGHSDHIAGNRAMKTRWPDCPLIIGAGDAPKLTDPELNLSAPFGVRVGQPAGGSDGGGGGYAGAGRHPTGGPRDPGAQRGARRLHLESTARPGSCLAGTCCFEAASGAPISPTGTHSNCFARFASKLFTLPADTVVLPGHGEPTTVEYERQTNPYVGRTNWRGRKPACRDAWLRGSHRVWAQQTAFGLPPQLAQRRLRLWPELRVGFGRLLKIVDRFAGASGHL